MSIFQSIFGSSSSAPAPQPSPGNTNIQPGTPGTQDNGIIPDSANKPASTETSSADKSPLDSFSEIWKIDPKASPDSDKIFSGVDPKDVLAAARKVDFAKSISTDQLEAIQKGGTEAVKAFTEAMNGVAQNVYAQNALASTRMIEQAIAKAKEQFNSTLPSTVRKLSANDNLMQSNPLLANPAVQPLVGALAEQLVRKNPDATQTEIQQQINDYFSAMGQAFGQNTTQPTSSTKSAEVDWEKFFQG